MLTAHLHAGRFDIMILCCLPGSSSYLARRLKIVQHVKLLTGLVHRLDGFDQSASFQLFQYLCDLWLLQICFEFHVFGPYTYNSMSYWFAPSVHSH